MSRRSSLIVPALFLLLFPFRAWPQQKKLEDSRPPAASEQEPPEEDPDLKPKVYSFNPLEASRSITTGDFYFHKGNYRAAAARYLEATKYDPASTPAFLKLGDAYTRQHEYKGAREAYQKYLDLMPDPKAAEAVKKKLEKLPADRRGGKK